jgi:hypothetical protein
VQRPGDEFLARPGLAADHHGEIGLHQPSQHPKDVLHRRRAADDRHGLGGSVVVGLLAVTLGLRERAPDNRDEFAQVEGLGQIFVGAAFGRLDRRHERVLGAHHDDRQVGTNALDAGQEIEGVVVGHHHVGDDEVPFAGGDPAPKSGDRPGRADLIPRTRQRLIQDSADSGIVVRNQNLP